MPRYIGANEATLHSAVSFKEDARKEFTTASTLRDRLRVWKLHFSNKFCRKKSNKIVKRHLAFWSDYLAGLLWNGYPSDILFMMVPNEPLAVKWFRETNFILYRHLRKKFEALDFRKNAEDGNKLDELNEMIAFTLHVKLNTLFFWKQTTLSTEN